MEKRIKSYESFIRKKISHGEISQSLIAYHREMIHNFQHERLIHLIIMLFFIVITLIATGFSIWVLANMDWSRASRISLSDWTGWLPLFIVALILWILSIAYVKHYYFLENHIQGLYDVSKELVEHKK